MNKFNMYKRPVKEEIKTKRMFDDIKNFKGNILTYTLNKFAINKDKELIDKVYFFLPCGYWLSSLPSGMKIKNKTQMISNLNLSRTGACFKGDLKDKQFEDGFTTIYFYDIIKNWLVFKNELLKQNRMFELELVDIYKNDLSKYNLL